MMIDYQNLLNEAYERTSNEADKANAKHDDLMNYDDYEKHLYAAGRARGYAEGLNMVWSIIGRLEKKARNND